MAKAGRGDDQYMVRFPSGLRDQIKAAADKNGRSMNSEIIARIDFSLERDEETENVTLPLPKDLLERIVDRSDGGEAGSILHLIVDALEKEFPPPAPRLNDMIELIKDQLAAGRYVDQEQRREAEEYVRAAELLFKAKPRLARRMVPPHTPTKPPSPIKKPFGDLKPGGSSRK
jgi:hypothetical protein